MVPEKKRGPEDRKQVNIHDPRECQRWAQHVRVSVEALIQAVLAVGRNAEAVAAHLGV